MAYCQQCGAQIADNAKFCGHCGHKNEPMLPTKKENAPVSQSGTYKKPEEAHKEKAKSSKKALVLMFLLVIVCLGLILFFIIANAVGESYNKPLITAQGEAVTPNVSKGLKYKTYQETVDIFLNRGFTNVKVEPVEGSRENEVKEVSINGNTQYERGQTVSADSLVLIRFYCGADTPIGLIDGVAYTPSQSSMIKSKTTEEVKRVFEGRGFNNITTDYVYDADKTENAVEKVTVNGNENYSSFEKCDPAVPVVIYINVNPNNPIETADGEAVTPATSSSMQGKNYADVIKIFEGRGFTNIKTQKITDLIFGWLTSDGEVEDVSVGGNTSYAAGQTVAADIEVVIRYHTFPGTESGGSETGGTENGESGSQGSSGSTTPQTSTESYGIGETAVTKSGISIVLEDVFQTQNKGSYFYPADPGKIYVILTFEAENNSSTSQSISLHDFSGYFDDYQIDVDWAADLELDRVVDFSGDIAAGKKLRGQVVFIADMSWKEMEIQYEYSWLHDPIIFKVNNN